MEDCILCGDTGGYPYCYGCQDTADMMGVDLDDIMENC